MKKQKNYHAYSRSLLNNQSQQPRSKPKQKHVPQQSNFSLNLQSITNPNLSKQKINYTISHSYSLQREIKLSKTIVQMNLNKKNQYSTIQPLFSNQLLSPTSQNILQRHKLSNNQASPFDLSYRSNHNQLNSTQKEDKLMSSQQNLHLVQSNNDLLGTSVTLDEVKINSIRIFQPDKQETNLLLNKIKQKIMTQHQMTQSLPNQDKENLNSKSHSHLYSFDLNENSKKDLQHSQKEKQDTGPPQGNKKFKLLEKVGIKF